jgi:hypothetical protein
LAAARASPQFSSASDAGWLDVSSGAGRYPAASSSIGSIGRRKKRMQKSKAVKSWLGGAVSGAVQLRGWTVVSVAALLCAGAGAMMPTQAWAESDAVKALAAPAPIRLPLRPSPGFAKFPRYAGMLGSRQIVLRLGPKTDDPSGVHGEYQYTDTGEVILIAGDRDGDTLEVEESNDGTHITGNWVGKFAADGTVSGDRMNVDDSDPQPFDLKLLAAGQPIPAPAAAPAAAPQAGGNGAAPASPASTAAGGHPVGGVSNLQTGD